MVSDANFKKILKCLDKIHKAFPELRFGHVIQVAMDKRGLRTNVDFSGRSSKEILGAFEEYHDSLKTAKNKGKDISGVK